MKRSSVFMFLCSALTLVVFAYCKKKDTETPGADDGVVFDKPAMLANYADSVIIPNLQAAKVNIDALVSSFENFSQNKTVVNLQDLRLKYIEAAVSFQYISTFEFGPSETEIVRSNFNTFPTDTTEINSNITTGNYNLGAVSNLDAKGFPAIDFLLYGKNLSDNSLIDLFTSSSKAAERTAYVKNCLQEIQSKLNTVVANWKNSYRDVFISSTGAQIGSSLGLLVNQLNFEVDALKNGKIGIPLGKKSLEVLLPEKCEAYYANTISVKLAKACLFNIENVYLGRSRNGVNGLGLDDYLIALNATHATGSLNDAINAQFATAKQKLSLVSEPLTDALVNNTAAVNAAYTEIVKLLVLLKTDTPSALGIVITYQDGDGD